MNGPWSSYPAGTPESQSANWTQVVNASGQAEWSYTGGGGAPPQQPYNITGGGDYTGSDYTYTPPPSTPAAGYSNPAKEGYVPPSSGDYFTLPDAQVPTQKSTVVTGYGGGASDFMSPVATGVYGLGTGSSLPVAPATAPLPNAAGTPQYGSGGNSGFVAGTGGGGGYDTSSGYTNPPASPFAAAQGGGMMLPNGQMFGAPKQMAPDGSFDPFLWSGTSNPMPPPGPMRTQILSELGLLPNQPAQSANPMTPMRYAETKLGVGSAAPQPALPPPPPAPGMPTSLPVAPAGGTTIPNLPPPILPGTRRRF